MVLKKQHMSKYARIAQHKQFKKEQKQIKTHHTPNYDSNIDKMADKLYKLKKEVKIHKDSSEISHYLNSLDQVTLKIIEKRNNELDELTDKLYELNQLYKGEKQSDEITNFLNSCYSYFR